MKSKYENHDRDMINFTFNKLLNVIVHISCYLFIMLILNMETYYAARDKLLCNLHQTN